MSGEAQPSAGCSTGQPLVSVIINCFNGMRYLREAIDSVYAQTYAAWEIIFWDNASTDESPAIAQSYDQRLRYFRGEQNVPLGAARNKAIEQAQGEYLCFLDCDDVWLPGKLERQIAAMERGQYTLGYAGVEEIDGSGQKIGQDVPDYPCGMLFEQLLFQFNINVPTAILKRARLLELGLNFDPTVTASEEYCLFMQLAVTEPILVMPEILAKYRIHDGALTAKSISKWALEREYTLDRIRNRHPEVESRFPRAFREAYARARYYRARYLVEVGDRKGARSELGKNLGLGWRYLLLFCLLFLPGVFWQAAHRLRSKRILACS